MYSREFTVADSRTVHEKIDALEYLVGRLLGHTNLDKVLADEEAKAAEEARQRSGVEPVVDPKDVAIADLQAQLAALQDGNKEKASADAEENLPSNPFNSGV